MTIDDKIRDEKLKYDINRETAKLSALSPGKTEKYELLTDDEILASNQIQIIEQLDFVYSPLEKAFEKQTRKQVGAIKSLDLSDKKDDLKQIKAIFPRNLINDLVRAKLKVSVNLIDIIKTDEL